MTLQAPWSTTDAGAQRKVALSFKIRVRTADDQPHAIGIGGIKLGNGSVCEDGIGIYAFDEDGGSSLTIQMIELYCPDGGGPTYSGGTSSVRIPRDKWADVSLIVNERPVGTAGGYVLSVDGQSQSFAITSTSRTPTLRVDLGLGSGSSGGNWTADYDDVTIDYAQ